MTSRETKQAAPGNSSDTLRFLLARSSRAATLPGEPIVYFLDFWSTCFIPFRRKFFWRDQVRPTLRVGALHLNPRPRSALLLRRPLSVGRFAALRFRPKNMAHKANFKIFPQLVPRPRRASPSLKSWCVTARPRYLALNTSTLLVGKKSVALALIRHFGSTKGFVSRFLSGTTAIPSTA